MSTWRAWVQASRPLAQANLAAPLIFGQALAFQHTGRFSWAVLGLVAAWGVLDQLFIVYSNDYADREDDVGAAAKTLFSGGSGVLPEGKLQPSALLRAAFAAFGLLGALSAYLGWTRSWWLVPLWLVAGFLMWAYSFAPLRLSYRGNGELLQGLGVGVVLPLVGFVSQAGELSSFPWLVLGATFLLGTAGNVSTALPDHNADRKANKRTWPVRFGVAKAAWACLGLTVTGIYAAIGAVPELPQRGMLGFAVVPLLFAMTLKLMVRKQVIRFVFLQGVATQLLLLIWSYLLTQSSP